MIIEITRNRFPPRPTVDPFTTTIYENHSVNAEVLTLSVLNAASLVS